MLRYAVWPTVRAVTGHDWLLLPGGILNQVLPGCLTECRWSCYATLKQNVGVYGTVSNGHWSDAISSAVPGSIACRKAGSGYGHGGLTGQGYVAPVFAVESGAASHPIGTAVEDGQ